MNKFSKTYSSCITETLYKYGKGKVPNNEYSMLLYV